MIAFCLAFQALWPDLSLMFEKQAPYIGWIQADRLHQLGLSGKGVTIAVIDEGFDIDHPLLQAQLEEEGYDTDVRSPFVEASRTYKGDGFVSESHGTHIAGILISQNPKYGGIARGSTLIPIKLGNQGGDQAFVKALTYAGNSPARIINLSMTLSFYNQAISPKIRSLLEQLAEKDKLIVIAAGNEGTPLTHTAYGQSLLALASSPKAQGRILLVGAYDWQRTWWTLEEKKASFSNYPGSSIYANTFLMAPGVSISGTAVYGKTGIFSGTSMAAPMVAGVAALLMEAFPHLSSQEIATLIRKGAKTTSKGHIPLAPDVFGVGFLDAWKAYQHGN